MKKLKHTLTVILSCFILFIPSVTSQSIQFPDDDTSIQRGYYNRPYKRYEAETNKCTTGGTVQALTATHNQQQLQSEASNQAAMQLVGKDSYVQWNCDEEADGMVIRFSIPDNSSGTGTKGYLALYVNGNLVQDNIELNSYWAWQYFLINKSVTDKHADNTPSESTKFPRMRFDEVRVKLSSKIPRNATFRLVKKDNNTTPYTIDFVELELVPAATTFAGIADADKVQYSGNGSDLQNFINNNGGKTIFIPSGKYDLNYRLYIHNSNTKIVGAGMWHTQLHFTAPLTGSTYSNRGIYSIASNITLDGLYLTTVNNIRYYQNNTDYQVGKALMGTFGSNSVIKNIWAEHFECGGWIADYSSGSVSNNLHIQHCRFRNNYADGINLCRGSKNSVVEYCSFRNNGDDDMASWSTGILTENNTFRYNTAENNWRASSIGFFGGKQNKAHHCVVMDPLEAALRVNSDFPGTIYSASGFLELHDISVYNAGSRFGVPGTDGDLWGNINGAIHLHCNILYDICYTKFTNIDIYNSRHTGIYIARNSNNGTSTKVYKDIYFENITIDNAKDCGINFYSAKGNGYHCRLQFRNMPAGSTNIASIPRVFDFVVTPGCISGVTDTEQNRIQAFSGNGCIELENLPAGENLTIYNLLGHKLHNETISSSYKKIGNLNAGLYIITISNQKESLKVMLAN